jgi:predicted transglutaminase-like cysteine proteinase
MKEVNITFFIWLKLVIVNLYWNLKIKYKTDIYKYELNEYWTYPENNEGDCEDYAIIKRKYLLKYNPKFAVCFTENGTYHAVLVIPGKKNYYILDNRYLMIKKINNLIDYSWDRIEGDNKWYAIKHPIENKFEFSDVVIPPTGWTYFIKREKND